MSRSKITSRFAPSIVKAALALEAACAYGDQALIAVNNYSFNKARDFYDGRDRNIAVCLASMNGYQAPGSKHVGTLVGECVNEMKAERRFAAQQAKKRREAAMLAREQTLYA